METALEEWTARGIGAPQDAMTEFGRELDTEKPLRGSIKLSFPELGVEEEGRVKGHPGADHRCDGGRPWQTSRGRASGEKGQFDLMLVRSLRQPYSANLPF